MYWNPTDAGDYIEGLTFTGGGVDQAAALYALVNNGLSASGTPRITKCVFADNDAQPNVGAVWVGSVGPDPAYPLLERNSFYGNRAVGEVARCGPALIPAPRSGMLVANGGTVSERWAGTTRYDTARVVAEKGVEQAFATCSYVGVATGENLPDALADGVAAGSNYGVIALTGSTALPVSTRDMLEANTARTMECDVYGGPGVVSIPVRTAIAAALGW